MKQNLRRLIFPTMAFILILNFYQGWISEADLYFVKIGVELYLIISTLVMLMFVFYSMVIKVSFNEKKEVKKDKETLEKFKKLIELLSNQVELIKKSNTNKILSLLIMVSLIVSSLGFLFILKYYFIGVLYSLFTLCWIFLNEYDIEKNILNPAKKKIKKS